MDDKTLVRDMTLMLLYLTSFRERKDCALRSWKGYDFGVLNALEDEDLIFGTSHKARSTYLTEEGEAAAKELLEKYFGQLSGKS